MSKLQSNSFSSNIIDKISDIYENQTYLERYGEYIFYAIIICSSFILVVTYIHIKINIEQIRADWNNQKCKPNIMPFAGIINAPDNMSKMEYTEKNFAECTQNILTDITDIALIPIHYTISIVTATVGEIMNIVNNMRQLVNKIRNSVAEITSDIMSRILNIMAPLTETIITAKSMLGKSNGVVTAVMYTLFGVYLSIKSLIGSILEIVIIILVAMAAAIILLFFIPIVGDILAATGIVFFLAISVPMGYLIGFSNNILNVHASRGVPGVPG
jgi:hypothetical protein